VQQFVLQTGAPFRLGALQHGGICEACNDELVNHHYSGDESAGHVHSCRFNSNC
jgi:hypothetical protein